MAGKSDMDESELSRWDFETLPADRPREIAFLFIAHGWHGMDVPLGTNVHSRLSRLLEFREDGFDRFDLSVSFLDPEASEGDEARNRALVEHRISEAEVVLLPSDVAHAERPWLKHEMGVARELGKPVLAIKPYGRRYWAKSFAEMADGLATYRRRSIIRGVTALRGLTDERRQELLQRGRPCGRCGSAQACLDLNRLGGTYCGDCGASTYRLPGFGRRSTSELYDYYGEGLFVAGATP